MQKQKKDRTKTMPTPKSPQNQNGRNKKMISRKTRRNRKTIFPKTKKQIPGTAHGRVLRRLTKKT